MKILVALIVGLTVLMSLAWVFRPTSLGAKPRGERLRRIERSASFHAGRFQNPVPTNKLEPGTFWSTLRQQLFGSGERVPRPPRHSAGGAPCRASIRSRNNSMSRLAVSSVVRIADRLSCSERTKRE